MDPPAVCIPLARWERIRVWGELGARRFRFSPRPLGEGQGEGRIRRGTSRTPSPTYALSGIVIKNLFKSRRRRRHRFSLARWERVRVREEFGAGRVRFSLVRWERVRVREEFETGRRGRRPLRMLFRAWLQRRVGLEPTPTIFFMNTGRRGRHRFSPRPLGEGRGEGRVRNGTSAPRTSACFARTPSPTDVLSGMVIKKGRFGTDPYDIFYEHGMSRKPSVFPLARRERVRVREEFKSGRRGRRPLQYAYALINHSV